MSKTLTKEPELAPVEVLDKVEGYKLLDRQTRKLLGMSADEFLREYDSGRWSGGEEVSEVMRLEMLIPFAR